MGIMNQISFFVYGRLILGSLQAIVMEDFRSYAGPYVDTLA